MNEGIELVPVIVISTLTLPMNEETSIENGVMTLAIVNESAPMRLGTSKY